MDVTVEARAGEVVGLAGLLGSGRTETAKAIYGAQPLDSGAVEVAGEPVKAGSPRAAISAGIALIPEDRKADGIIPTLSVRENIVLAALPTISRAGFVSERQQDALVEALMRRLRIKASSPDQRVSELSGGNQQKVLLARVLCLEPRVLLLDDPTRGIDVGAKAEIQGLISDLAEAGLAVVLISSELEEVVEGADRIIVLRDGAVVGTLSGAEVTQDGVLGPDRGSGAAGGGQDRPEDGLSSIRGRDGPEHGRPHAWRRRCRPLSWPRAGARSAASRSSTGSPSEASTRAPAPRSPSIWCSRRASPRSTTSACSSCRSSRSRSSRSGMALVIGTRGIDLSVGSVMAIASALLALYLGYGPAVAITIALLGGASVGVVNGVLISRFGIQPIVATLALLVGGRGLALVIAQGRLTEIFDPP